MKLCTYYAGSIYGMDQYSIVDESSTQSSILNLILEKEYLNVFTFVGDEQVYVCLVGVFLLFICFL